jgi:hypothetical protein
MHLQYTLTQIFCDTGLEYTTIYNFHNTNGIISVELPDLSTTEDWKPVVSSFLLSNGIVEVVQISSSINIIESNVLDMTGPVAAKFGYGSYV